MPGIRRRFIEALKAIAPLIGVVCALQATVVRAPAAEFVQFLAGSALVVAGLFLLVAGVEAGILPMGRYIGAELPRKRSLWLIAAVAAAVGFATTAAEPDVLVLSRQVAAESGGAVAAQPLAYLIAAGVALFAAAALLRIVAGVSMSIVLALCYGTIIVLSLAAPAAFVPLAYDAGSVTTGVVSAPALLALALGLSSVLAGRSAAADGFGVLGVASAGPVIVILLLGLILA